jgi:hypothetical protein
VSKYAQPELWLGILDAVRTALNQGTVVSEGNSRVWHRSVTLLSLRDLILR